MIKETYRFLKFESILQYVALPTLLPSSPSESDRNGPNNNSGPTHYRDVFDWLRDANKDRPTQVLRIIVEDDLDNPHSDETIIKAVERLGVEVWNWRKYDINSETIRKAAPEVKEVHLYSTGNAAVLRGWSDEGGLRKLNHVSFKKWETECRVVLTASCSLKRSIYMSR